MHLSHKIELCPNNKQATYFKKACGTARFTYNYLLAQHKEQLDKYKKDKTIKLKSIQDLMKDLNKIKKHEFPWMKEITKYATQCGGLNLEDAQKRYFKKQSGFPKFKKKYHNDSFYIGNDVFKLDKKKCYIPKLGWVKMTQELRFKGKIMSATVSRKADKWFISINVELENLNHLKGAENQGSIGIDLGISTFATLSNGEKIYAPKPLKKYLAKLKAIDRALSRSKKVKITDDKTGKEISVSSNNRKKLIQKRARLFYKISCIRKDFLDKVTSDLTRRFHTIVLETLNIKGMIKNGNLARAISDLGWYEFKRQLAYKSDMRGNKIIYADRFYPSSKTCSGCGNIRKGLTLSDRIYVCESEKCGLILDRDLNAALNLNRLSKVAVSLPVEKVCGENISGF